MRIAIAQLDYHIGNFEGNLAKMVAAVGEAMEKGADLICFGEMAVCGYPPRDFLEFEDFIRQCEASVEALLPHSERIAIVVGAPVRNPLVEGKDLFNAALFLAEGRVLHTYHKALLPTYDVFDEYRYFEPGSTFDIVRWRGLGIALTVCEDIWNVGNENPLYTTCPLDEMLPHRPDLVLNLSASPFSYAQAGVRKRMLQANVARYKLPIFYVNHIGAQTELIFDGGSVVMSPDGLVHDEMAYFEEDLRVYELDAVRQGGVHREQSHDKIRLMHDALVLGLRDYFRKLGLQKAILGLSGGIDSAVTAALAATALGPDNVTGLILPSPYSSGHSVLDALELADKLGIDHTVIPIEPGYQALLDMVEPHFEGRAFDVTEENIQARIRGITLMAFSNKMGHILLNTTNKSEMAVGYGTLYGDLCGGLSVLGDVYKTEVYALAHYINRDRELIPRNSIEKPPSAELRPDQKDSDSLPEYDILDVILYQYIERRQGPREIIAQGFDEALVRRILGLVNRNEFKRYQTAPVLRVSPKAFGMGRRMPIVGKYLT